MLFVLRILHAWSGVHTLEGGDSATKIAVSVNGIHERSTACRGCSVQILLSSACDFSLVSTIKWHELQCLTGSRDERYTVCIYWMCMIHASKEV